MELIISNTGVILLKIDLKAKINYLFSIKIIKTCICKVIFKIYSDMICNDTILGYMLFSSSQYLTDSTFVEGMKNNHQITTLSPLLEVEKLHSQINRILL